MSEMLRCKECLFQLPEPSCQLKPVCLFFSQLLLFSSFFCFFFNHSLQLLKLLCVDIPGSGSYHPANVMSELNQLFLKFSNMPLWHKHWDYVFPNLMFNVNIDSSSWPVSALMQNFDLVNFPGRLLKEQWWLSTQLIHSSHSRMKDRRMHSSPGCARTRLHKTSTRTYVATVSAESEIHNLCFDAMSWNSLNWLIKVHFLNRFGHG